MSQVKIYSVIGLVIVLIVGASTFILRKATDKENVTTIENAEVVNLIQNELQKQKTISLGLYTEYGDSEWLYGARVDWLIW